MTTIDYHRENTHNLENGACYTKKMLHPVSEDDEDVVLGAGALPEAKTVYGHEVHTKKGDTDPQEIGEADCAMYRGTGLSRRGSFQNHSSRLRVRLAITGPSWALRDTRRG